jgi:hypothetical protein
MMTARLYKRVLEQAVDVSVDIPVPSLEQKEDVTLLEYQLPTLAALFVVEPLEVEYSKVPAAVLKALSVNSYTDAPIFELINNAYKDKMGHPPTEHAYFMCQNKHNSMDEEAHKRLVDNHMYEAFDSLLCHLAEMETEDPEQVAQSIQHQIDKINGFYKQVSDEQRERLRSMKQQTDEAVRAMALQEARRKDEENAHMNQRAAQMRPPPNPTAPPSLHPGKNTFGRLFKSETGTSVVQTSGTTLRPIIDIAPRRDVPITPGNVPINQLSGTTVTGLNRGGTVLNSNSNPNNPTLVKKNPVHLSLRDAIANAREHAATTLAAELEEAPMPVVDYGVPPPAPPAEPQPSRQEFLERMKRMQAERKAQAPPAIQPDPVQQQPQNHAPVLSAGKQAFLNKFKEREQARYSEMAV